MLDTKRFGKRIAFLRKQTGMSQESLAQLLYISPQAISKWENGHTVPETPLLPVLAQIFNCSIDEMIMPAYLFDSDIEEKKRSKLEKQAEYIADFIIRKLGGIKTEECIGLDDHAIMEAVRRVHPNLGNYEITRGKPEAHHKYISIYITVTTSQETIGLVEKVYQSDEKELAGYQLFSRYVTAIPRIYDIDFDKKILLMEEVNDRIQGTCFDENNESGKIFRDNYYALLEETAKVHATFWENKAAFQKIGLDERHKSEKNLLAHINGMEQDFLAYRKAEGAGKIPKVWSGLSNTIDAGKLDYFQDAIEFLRQRYIPLIEERFDTEQNITVIHGDLHPGNLFVSKQPRSDVKMIDMEAVRRGLCTEDLAMLLALHIQPDKKSAKPLLDYYYQCLCREIKTYSYEMFMDDYRISIAEAMFYTIRLMNSGIYDFEMRDRAVRAYETFVAVN